MTVKELRIGNLVYKQIPKKNTPLEIVDILSIDGSFEVLEVKNAELYITEECPLDKFEPIPLTEEWLLKFGFVKEPLAYSINIDKFGKGKKITISSDYLYIVDSEKQNTIPTDIITIWNKDIIKEFYVHQLQNLYFALTGEELTIKKEKNN